MKRNLQKLAQDNYDLIIIGGGIYGACAFWDASLRNLKVALLEKRDFSNETSSNSLKIGHGGLRYLQDGSFSRMRNFLKERSTLMHIAPHMVGYRSFLMPTYGHGLRGPEIMGMALAVQDMFDLEQRWRRDLRKRIPGGRLISREECLQRAPGIQKKNLTGGALWHEGHILNTERLVLSFLLSGENQGGHAANYVEVTGFLMEKNQVKGVVARDGLTGRTFRARSKVVLNTAGPWVNDVLGFLPQKMGQSTAFLKSIILVTRPLTHEDALALSVKPMHWDEDALVHKKSSFIFSVPWRGSSMIGSFHFPYHHSPDAFHVTEEDLREALCQINEAYPSAVLNRKDICYVYCGMVPAVSPGGTASLKQPKIIHHQKQGGPAGLISVIGVKYTTARAVAQKAVDMVYQLLGFNSPQCRTDQVPLVGGEQVEEFIQNSLKTKPEGWDKAQLMRLIAHYGTKLSKLYTLIDEQPEWKAPLTPDGIILKAEVVHAVREEMAEKLTDVIFRRTALGDGFYPGDSAVQAAASLMSQEMHWSKDRMEKEIEEAKHQFNFHHARPVWKKLK